jgi:uncharacterized membrane protein (UPF0136 family)
MKNGKKLALNSKNLALTICFSSLYAIFCFFPIFQIIGLQNKFITMAAVLSPFIGMLLGPFVGALSTTVGGLIGFSVGNFSLPSLASGVVAAFFAGSLLKGRRSLCVFFYFSLLFLFGFYPFVGPAWLFPPLMWFQVIGFLVLVLPIQPPKNSFLAFFVISLTSTLAGQIAGSLTLEIISWPIFVADLDAWRVNWQLVTFLYPMERVVIAFSSAFFGKAACRVLKPTGLMQAVNGGGQQKECP